MKKYKFKIRGLDCANCANELENVLQKMDGIKDLSINYMRERLFFSCFEEDKEIIFEKIQKRIKKEEPGVTIKEVSNG